ncbi:MAG: hypothetical protein OHK0039_02570 [Bacteroidia bacterium]
MNAPHRNAEQLLGELRSLLLLQDRETQAQLREQIDHLRHLIEDEEALGEKLAPHLERQVAYLQTHFPELFGVCLGAAIRYQIQHAREEIIDALHPLIGRLVVRYVQTEIHRLSEWLDERLRDPFSLATLRLRIQALISGVSYQQLLLRQMDRPRIEEVFLIQKTTGLPLGHFSLNHISHPDIVAGMLTGIKSFVEHAFEKEEQELQTLRYDRYEILLFSFEHFYFATVLAGSPDASFQLRLREAVFSFCDQYTIASESDGSTSMNSRTHMSDLLQAHFDGFNATP